MSIFHYEFRRFGFLILVILILVITLHIVYTICNIESQTVKTIIAGITGIVTGCAFGVVYRKYFPYRTNSDKTS